LENKPEHKQDIVIHKDIAILKNEIKYINKHLVGIDNTMKKLQDLMLEQNDLRKEITTALKEHDEMRKELSGFGKRVSDNEKEITTLKTNIENATTKFKSNIFDYIWKYATLAVGSWIALKITGVLP